MTEVSNVAPGDGGGIPAPVVAPVDSRESFSSPSAAAKALSAARWAKRNEQAAAQETVTAPDEIPPQGDNAAPPDEDHGDTTLEADPAAAELPIIEPPRSWTQAEKERFASLPRETQEYLHTREQERDREFRRGQNEVAEQRKAFEAQRQAAEQARLQYEQQLPALMQALQDQQSGQFPDVRTIDDVNRLAQEDPFRYLQWDAHQKRVAAVNLELRSAQERQAKDMEAQWANYIQSENSLMAERVPELADGKKAAELTAKAVDTLRDLGFTDTELAELASGRKAIPIYDHRLQLLILDGVKYRDAKKTASVAQPKSVPPVQRPGVASPKGAAMSEQIQALSAKLENTGSLKDAVALRELQLASRRR